MKSKTYFDKYGVVYGVSYKYNDGWHSYVKAFCNYGKAVEWLNTEEYDFRTRVLCSKSEAERLMRKYYYLELSAKECVENAYFEARYE